MFRGIILVVLDCVRADHISALGYHRFTTPTIDALAARGHLWSNAYSTSSWTKPSVASLLTGLHPSQHGVLRGPKRSRGRAAHLTDVLPTEVPTVAEVFTMSGRRCSAFLNNVQLDRYSGFHRGFETYCPIVPGADRQLQSMADWLSERDGVPFFVYLHFMEAHWPYKPRRRHVAMFGGDRDNNRFSRFSALDFASLRRSVSRSKEVLSSSDRRDLETMYDGAIRRLDGKIKALLRILADRRLDEVTAIVVTADHGEEFLDHGSLGHGRTLHVEATRVPLIMFLPGERASVRHDEPVSLVDVAKTLLTLGNAPSDMPGHDLLFAGGRRSPAYCELSAGRSFWRALRHGSWRLHRQARSARSSPESPLDFARSAVSGEFQAEEKVHIFDMIEDPCEQCDVSGTPEGAEAIVRLTGEMAWHNRETMKRCVASGATQAEVSPVVVERLRDLGYIE